MYLVFTKGSGKYDVMEVFRDATVAERVECPKQGIIPHDMIHYALEQTLQRRGFVGRLLDGEPASFHMQPEAESEGVERLVEVFQADGWSGWTSSPTDMLDLYQVTCSARQCAPLALHAADIDAVRKRILELAEQWQLLAVGKSLALQFGYADRAI